MGNPWEAVLGSIAIAASVGLLSYFAREWVELWIGWLDRDLCDKLRRLRMYRKTVRPWIYAWLTSMVVVFVVFCFVLDNIVFAVLLPVGIGFVPWLYIRRRAEQRRLQVEGQLADAMVMLSNAVKSGMALAQALELLAAQCPKPISLEFQQIVGEYKLGRPLERTLLEAKARLRSENFALFAAALLASHESGGRLNETVERIAKSVLEMQRLERKVRSETAQARKSAVYMALAPAIILLVYYFVDKENTERLFTTIVGQLLLATAMALNIIAYFWARAILSAKL